MKRILLFIAGEIESPEGIRAYYLFREREDVKIISRDTKFAYYWAVLYYLFFGLKRNVYLMGFDILTVFLTLFRNIFLPVNIIYDTGDIQCELSRAFRPFWLTWLVCFLEKWLISSANVIIVRTGELKKIFEKEGKVVFLIRDGVDFSLYSKFTSLPDDIVVGTTGTFNRDRRTGRISGSEVIEVLVHLREMGINAKGLIAGQNSVYRELVSLVKREGVEVKFIPHWTPYRKFPYILKDITFAINLQTNDRIGSVRLGGKVPPYLATGRYIISSDVPECRDVLPAHFLVEYKGKDDKDFSKRVAERIKDVLEHNSRLERRLDGIKLAKKFFEYKLLRKELSQILKSKVL